MNELMLCLCLSFSGGPGTPDRFFAEDKLKHFAVSFAFTSMAASGARLTGLERGPSLAVGATAGVALGVAKELRDLGKESETASLLDLTWDVLGVGAATVMVAQAR